MCVAGCGSSACIASLINICHDLYIFAKLQSLNKVCFDEMDRSFGEPVPEI